MLFDWSSILPADKLSVVVTHGVLSLPKQLFNAWRVRQFIDRDREDAHLIDAPSSIYADEVPDHGIHAGRKTCSAPVLGPAAI